MHKNSFAHGYWHVSGKTAETSISLNSFWKNWKSGSTSPLVATLNSPLFILLLNELFSSPPNSPSNKKTMPLAPHCYFYYYGAIIWSCGYCGIKSSNVRDHKWFSKISSSPLINKNMHFFKCFTAVNTFGASVSIFFLFYRDFQKKKYFSFIVLNGKLLQKWTGPHENREKESKNSKLHLGFVSYER